jgi:hypothetical protein
MSDEEDQLAEDEAPRPRSRLLRYPLLALAVGLFVFELVSVFFGGYQFGTISYSPVAFGGFTGLTLGMKSFYAPAGATVEVRYDAEIRRGSFYLYV